jgi:hypothetical protein
MNDNPRAQFLERLAEFNRAGARLSDVWERAQQAIGADIGVEDYPFSDDFEDVSLQIMRWSAKQHELVQARTLTSIKVDGPWLENEGSWLINIESALYGFVTFSGFSTKEAALLGAEAFLKGSGEQGGGSEMQSRLSRIEAELASVNATLIEAGLRPENRP